MGKFIIKFYKKYIRENAKLKACVRNSGFTGKQLYVRLIVFDEVMFEQILPVDLMDCDIPEERLDIKKEPFSLPKVPLNTVFGGEK